MRVSCEGQKKKKKNHADAAGWESFQTSKCSSRGNLQVEFSAVLYPTAPYCTVLCVLLQMVCVCAMVDRGHHVELRRGEVQDGRGHRIGIISLWPPQQLPMA